MERAQSNQGSQEMIERFDREIWLGYVGATYLDADDEQLDTDSALFSQDHAARNLVEHADLEERLGVCGVSSARIILTNHQASGLDRGDYLAG